MSEQPDAAKTSFWDLASTRIGVISTAVGLVVALVGLPNAVRDAVGLGDKEPSRDDGAVRAQLVATSPRLEPSYVFLRPDLVDRARFAQGPRPTTAAARTIVSFPIVEPDLLAELGDRQRVVRDARLGEFPASSTAFLVIRNHGRRNAAAVSVDVDRLRLRGAVRIREGLFEKDDYVARLRANASESKTGTIRVPTILAPGDGVLVPLFATLSPEDRLDRWWVVSRTALLPRSVRFVDQELRSRLSRPVRRLANPLVLDSGVVGRG